MKKKSALYKRGYNKGQKDAILSIKKKLGKRASLFIDPGNYVNFSNDIVLYNRGEKTLVIYGKPGQIVTFFTREYKG